MQVSVVIPAFNRAHTLPRALDSVLAQTSAPAEVIVVDDGSTDGTARLLARHYPTVIRLAQDNRGVSHARNQGIAAARHDWIALLDSDDCWSPHKLQSQTQWLTRRPASWLCHCDEIWIRDGRRVNPMRKHAKHGGEIFGHCLPRCAISPSATLLHKRLLAECGGFDETLPACEDYDLWLRICARHAVAYLPQALVTRYGGHADQLSHRHWGMDRFRVQALENLLANHPLTPAQQTDTLRTLLEKLAILGTGAGKRGNRPLVESCQRKHARYTARLSALRNAA